MTCRAVRRDPARRVFSPPSAPSAKRASLERRLPLAWLTVAEFAEHEGVTPRTIRKWITQGLPACDGPDGKAVIDIEEGEAWLDIEAEKDGHEEGNPDVNGD